jgi:hypothetical protein
MMKVLVYMRDGRTVYLIEKRGLLRALIGNDPAHEGKSVFSVRGTWNPHTGMYVWRPVPLRHLSPSSIAVVEEARGVDDAVAMLEPTDPDAIDPRTGRLWSR